ncbi:ead/Ea22-like family protein [Salmonella enterica]|nr:hypothetical protein [Salmonella enterica]EBC6994356.1 ead/Ea22-like family protein [Salmonella enterica]
MSNIDKQALLGPDKHSNQHKLSRLIAEANSAEIRDIAEAVEQYTDQLIAALEAAEKRIAEQREYYEGVIADGSKRIAELEAREVTLPSEKFCPSEYTGSQYWEETEVWNKAISACAVAVRAAGIKIKGERDG